MGTWGGGLYDDDSAADLKSAVSVLSKLPGADGSRLLELLLQDRTPGPDEEGGLFWLVVADQFEKKGIAEPELRQRALSVIDDGSHLVDAQERGADAGFLKERRKALEELAARLRSPRPERAAAKAGKPPVQPFEAGEIYTFPTMKQCARHPYWVERLSGPWIADGGFGALVVLAAGRAWDWFPWVALASLTGPGDRPMTLDEALAGKLLHQDPPDGASLYCPKPAHLKLMGLQLLGRVALDAAKVSAKVSSRPVAQFIQYNWTICYAGYRGDRVGMYIPDTELASLLA
jgi:hypothetical protein